MPRISNNLSENDLYRKRHSVSHVLAQAVLEIFPSAQLGIGPAIKDGFYYDFLLPEPLNPEKLVTIEARMLEIIKEGHPFIYEQISYDKARELFSSQRFKTELIEELRERGETISVYRDGKFYDLCKGPHAKSLKEINPDGVKLLKVSGAYWKGDENREMLQRIYGTYFDTKEELEDWLKKREEAEKYDHRTLGKNLRLFTISEQVGPGLILWLPKGATLRKVVETLIHEILIENGYKFVYTPHIGKSNLWEISGHLEHYRENMFSSMIVDNDEYFVKPMNCPFHIQIYNEMVKSFRDLPLRLAEFGSVYRFEKSGVLHGLTRVRGFTQDDGHIFCTDSQLEEEISSVVDISLSVLKKFKFTDFSVYISTKPDKFAGDEKLWKHAEEVLEKVLDRFNINYYVDEGGGAFYGPKIDIKIEDSLGREWQLTTIQLDFNLPVKFKLEYTASDGSKKTPIMIHRAIFGSLERFIGVLIEHYRGNLPFWLAPEQIRLISVSEKHNPYLNLVKENLAEFRYSVDETNERLSYKVRKAEEEKIPYVIIVGAKEEQSRTVSVRSKKDGDLGNVALDDVKQFFDEKLRCWE